MIKAKSILKRTLAVVLALLTLLSTGIVSTLAATVELAPTGADISADTVFYFENVWGWNDSVIQLMVGHGSWSQGYEMTKINNTNLYYVKMASWGGFTQIAVFGTSSVWGGEGSSVSHRKSYATHSTPVATPGNLSGYVFLTPSDNELSVNQQTSYGTFNKDQSIEAKSDGETVTDAATFSVASYCLNSTGGANGATATSGETSAQAVKSANVTLKVSNVASGYTFLGWSSDGTTVISDATENTYTYVCDGTAKTHYALFEKAKNYNVDLTTSVTGGTASADKTTVPAGENVTLTATAYPGYTFSSWEITGTYTGTATSSTCTITPTTDITVKPVFTAIPYTVTASPSLTNGATFTYSPSTSTHTYGDTVTVIAIPDTENGYVFNSWTVPDGVVYTADGASITVTVNGNIELTANLTQKAHYDITLSAGTGGKAEGSKPDGVYEGDSIELTATPNPGYHFDHWEISGGHTVVSGENTSESITITPTGDITANAIFAANSGTIIIAAGAGGSVTSEGTHPLDSTTYVESTATPLDSHNFVSWNITGTEGTDYELIDCEATNATIKIRILADNTEVTATATFAIKTYTVTFKNGVNGDTISTATVNHGGTVTAPTIPTETGYTFKSWDKSLDNITADTTITANYDPNTYTITLNQASEGGEATVSSKTVTYPGTVKLTATATGDYIFTNWEITGSYDPVTDGGNENSEEFTIKPTSNLTITPVFAEGQKLTVHSLSDDGYNNLTLTEGNTTHINGAPQPYTNDFNGVTWNSSEKVALNGDSTEVSAILSSGAATSANDIYIQLSSEWLDNDWTYNNYIYLYTVNSSNSSYIDNLSSSTNYKNYKPDSDSSIGSGTCIDSTNHIYKFSLTDTQISNATTYGFALMSKQAPDKLWEMCIAHFHYDSSKNYYTVSSSYTLRGDNTNYRGNEFTITKSSLATSTGNIDLSDYLYNGTTWRGNTEVWIYDGAEGVVVTTRAKLIKLIDQVTATYNGGVNYGYTTDTWDAFVEAYEAAYDASGATTSDQTAIDNAESALRTAYAGLVYDKTSDVTVTQNVAGGTVTISNTQITSTSETVRIPQNFAQKINITAPTGYYVAFVFVNGTTLHQTGVETTKTYSGSCSFTADTGTVMVTYSPRTSYTITVEAFENYGTLSYNSHGSITSEGGTIKTYNGDTVTITANPNEDYEVTGWTVNGNARPASPTLTLTASSNITVTVTWGKIQYYNVSIEAMPNSVATVTAIADTKAGTTTVQNINGQNILNVAKGTQVQLSSSVTNGKYSFAGWIIEGEYTIIAGSGNLAKEAVTIRANSELRIVANYVLKSSNIIYLKNDAGWDEPYVYYWGSSTSVDWPGVEMEYDSALDLWYAAIPEDAPNIKFSDNKENETDDFTNIGDKNYYNNSTGTLSKYIEDGYYLAGWWNDNSRPLDERIKLEQLIDGRYTTTIKVNVDTNNYGYIYAYVSEEDGTKWGASTQHNTANPQTLIKNSSNDAMAWFPDDTTLPYFVTFYFNDQNGEFSWEFEEAPETVLVYGNDGQTKTSADSNMNSNNGRLGDTYFDFTNVYKTTVYEYYTLADVTKNASVTFYTQVNDNGAGGYDYYVDGWVVNGNQYVKADSLGNGLYSGTTLFSDAENTVTPVYFHTEAWLTANNVSRVTVYAVNNNDITNWDKYMSAYTWFDQVDGGYRQFGSYTGQLMIPVTGSDGVYYTYLETTSPKADNNQTVKGIVFSNHGDANNGYDVSGDILGYGDYKSLDHIQTYDFYEFIALNEDKKENITFVLKDTNDTVNDDRVVSSIDTGTAGNWDFVQFVDYSGLRTDIFGNSIEDKEKANELTDTDALYVVRVGDQDVDSDPLHGDWYVKCYLYNKSGTQLGSCYSYQLSDKDDDIWDILEPYKYKRAYISYEAGRKYDSTTRYDGQWYGDADINVTVNLAVNVAEMSNGTYTVSDATLNVATYGTAYISVDKQNIDITRNETATIIAQPAAGYKFVGWYTKDGTFFSTEPEKDVIAGVGTYYTAVFEKLDDGIFTVNHFKYTGSGATATSYPKAHGGNAILYVGVENTSTGASDAYKQGNSAYVAAKEGDILKITIGTDPTGAHKFYAWYVDAVDKYNLKSFEEVGVDTEENLAFSDSTSEYYMNVNTVEGSNDIVYFQFLYQVKNNDDFNVTIYSDVENVTTTRTITYKYADRYDNTRTYVVKVELSDDEVSGFAGNNYTAYTPAYISGDTWNNTVLMNAPYVGDFYKNVSWNVMDFKPTGLEIWATEAEKEYTITFIDGEVTQVVRPEFNEVAEYEAAEGRGFWFNDTNFNNVYDKDVDLLLAYTNRYALRVTQSMNIVYHRTTEQLDFAVTIDPPVYGRVQETDSEGDNKTDKVQADYVINILTPYLYGYSDFKPAYGDKEITENWNGSHVTVDSLENAGYTVSYGVVLEQVASIAIEDKDNYDDALVAYGEALLKANDLGFGKKTDESILNAAMADQSQKIHVVNGANHAFYFYDFTTKYQLTDMNRYQYYFEVNNELKYWRRFYNVYAYVTVTTPADTDGNKTTTTYFSNVQTLNIYLEGQSDPASTSNFGAL